jgi:fumarylpyruvate hydrolase
MTSASPAAAAGPFLFPPPGPPAAPLEGGGLFPVRRIYCVGRNYGKHVAEMGGDPKAQPPIFFMKPADAATAAGEVPYPPGTRNLHHEVELVLALGGGGANLSPERAMELVAALGVGVDLTRRDLQNEAKDRGQPWDAAKGFDASAPLGLLRPLEACGPLDGRIWLSVNGRPRQDASLSEMIWSPPEIIAALSRLWRLEAGDLIFTGTPEGVGPLVPGDHVECGVEGVGGLAFVVAPPVGP